MLVEKPSFQKRGPLSSKRIAIIFGLLIIFISIVSVILITTIRPQEPSRKESIQDLTIQRFNGNFIPINVTTDHVKYLTGQSIKIYGSVSNDFHSSSSIEAKMIIIVSSVGSNSLTPIYQTSMFTNGTFLDSNLKIEQAGLYRVDAISIEGNNTGKAFILFDVYEPFTSLPAYFMYGTIASVGILMAVILIDVKRSTYVSEILRFACISAIAFLPIMCLLFADLQVGANSPVGLIVKPPIDENGKVKVDANRQPLPGGEWKINVGGHQDNHYESGMQIPISVVIFGIAGSYIRYLYKTAHLKITHNELNKIKVKVLSHSNAKSLKELQRDHLGLTDGNVKKFMDETGETDSERAVRHMIIIRKRRKYLFYQSLKDIALFILAPLLAVVVWFLLLEAGMTNAYALAVVSFVVGLFIEQVMVTLREFLGTILRNVGDKIEKEGGREEGENDEAEKGKSKAESIGIA